MNNTTDTNQASEDELLDCLIDKTVEARYLWSKQSAEARQKGYGNTGFTKYQKDLKEAHESAKAAIQSIIRTEKLKLLAEVRERVVGENASKGTYMTYSSLTPVMQDFRASICNDLKDDQRAALTKLEAEL